MKDLLDQIEELKALSTKIYDTAGNIRDQGTEPLKDACNAMRYLSGKLSEVMDMANDIIIYTVRDEPLNLERTRRKINKYYPDEN